MATAEEKRIAEELLRQQMAQAMAIQPQAPQAPPGMSAQALRRQGIVDATTQAYTPAGLSAEEQAAQSQADALAARTQATAAYNEKDKWKGHGLLGMPAAMLINQFHDKEGKIAAREEPILQGLNKARELNAAAEKRKGLEKAKLAGFNVGAEYDKEMRGNEFSTGERVAEQGFKTGERLAEQDYGTAADTTDFTRGLATERAKGIYKSNETAQEKYQTAAESAVTTLDQIDNFLAASSGGTEGGAQPIISAAENFLSSFGFHSDELEQVALMDKAVGSIKADYLAQLGARGLTDTDMKILATALPNVATSKEARTAVAEVLRKESNNKIYKYLDIAEKEEAQNPGARMRPSWYEDAKNGRKYQAYKLYQQRQREKQASRWD